ncbi:DinB family protein [Paenibacillus sp. YPG26]|uniref:DinB family protein n=1 Tax=Paenibacillus sp. YPG26 TaxID=2878915 RepID=UPI0020423076|nr:DinB family protein [Paenibacillus sp. YPG26]USB33048.1 DinB family protein [Paenibacillus sp. YPG26]
MNIKKTSVIVQDLKQLTSHYLENVERLSLQQLQQVPSEGGWSLGQMYMHLIGTALHMQLKNAERCLSGNGDPFEEPAKTEAGTKIFELGGFPPVRVQVPPSPQYTPAQPESKEQLVAGLHQAAAKMEELEARVNESAEEHRAVHPRLGALTALEWFALTEMHYRHHLLQEERLLQALGA